MSPPAVVRTARERGLDLIAVCDHNSAENVGAATRAARDTGLAVIGGMEICTREEVHVLGIFDDGLALSSAQQAVYQNLSGENNPEVFGEQLVMNERGEVVGHNSRLLIGATGLSLKEVVGTIHSLGGLAIAAHVDRPRFSVISQLGFVPPGLELDGAEVCSDVATTVSVVDTAQAGRLRLPEGLAVVRSSDAHRPEEIGSRCTRLLVEEPTACEVGKALRRIEGRRILV